MREDVKERIASATTVAFGGLAIFGVGYLIVDGVKTVIKKVADDEIRRYHNSIIKSEKDSPYKALEEAWGSEVANQIYWAYKADKIGKAEFDDEVFKARLFLANGIKYERKNK